MICNGKRGGISRLSHRLAARISSAHCTRQEEGQGPVASDKLRYLRSHFALRVYISMVSVFGFRHFDIRHVQRQHFSEGNL